MVRDDLVQIYPICDIRICFHVALATIDPLCSLHFE